MDLVLRGTARAYRARLLTTLSAWLERVFGKAPAHPDRFERALTHGSHGSAD